MQTLSRKEKDVGGSRRDEMAGNKAVSGDESERMRKERKGMGEEGEGEIVDGRKGGREERKAG